MLTEIQFSAFLQEAYRAGVPRGYERAILREYLQCEILSIITASGDSERLAFIGGTALRLLYDLDRFSEDLDFDHFSSQKKGFPIPLADIAATLKRRGYDISLRMKSANAGRGGTLIFSDILFSLGLSPHYDETLKIKIEYTDQPKERTELRVLNRFGFAEQIPTLPLEVLCARKVHALFSRKRLQPRDLYDLAWFFSRRVKPDPSVLQRIMQIQSNDMLLLKIKRLYQTHRTALAGYERDMRPFLIDQNKSTLIRLLPSIAESLFA